MKTLVSIAAVALLGTSCGSTWYSHKFLPAPIEAPVQIEDDDSAQARVLVTVMGIRRADKQAGTPIQVEARMQVENLGSTPALLVVEGLALRASDLTEFDTAVVTPPQPEALAQGEQALYEIAFPIPPDKEFGDIELRGLHLSWELSFGDRTVTTGVTFERREQMSPSASGSMNVHYGRYRGRYSTPRPTPY